MIFINHISTHSLFSYINNNNNNKHDNSYLTVYNDSSFLYVRLDYRTYKTRCMCYCLIKNFSLFLIYGDDDDNDLFLPFFSYFLFFFYIQRVYPL